MRMFGTECIRNILFILPLGAEWMEWHSDHSGIRMRNKRTRAFHILAILIPELWIKKRSLKSSLITLYYYLVYPYLLYCVSVWGSTYPTNLNRLLLLQKQLIRTITKQAFDAHTEPIFKELGKLKLNDIYLLQIGKVMYLYKIGLLPNSFNNVFLMVNQVHNHNTINKYSFYITSCRTKVRQFSFQYRPRPKIL